MKNHKQCPLPFTQLYLHSTGDVFPCSFAQNYPLGNVKEQTLEEIWHGPKLAEFRKAHLALDNDQCRRSQKDHACHLHHERLREMAKYNVKVSEPPIRLDFMVDSFCNLKCVMCTNVLEDNGGYEHEEFWQHCREKIFPYVKEIEIIGGEPLILDNTFKLIDLVSECNPNCLWRVTTNAHYQFNEKFKKAADKMHFESFAVSVDSLKPEVFSSIRKGARLDLVLKTLDDWNEYSKTRAKDRPMKVVVNFVVQKENAFELPNFIDFCLKKDLVPYAILLRDPVPFTIFDLPEEELGAIFDFYLEAQEKAPHATLALICHKIFKELPQNLKLKNIEKMSQVLAAPQST